MNDQFFVRSVELEARLELANKRSWELEQLLERAVMLYTLRAKQLTNSEEQWLLEAQRKLKNEL